jgi:hypothetical protein
MVGWTKESSIAAVKARIENNELRRQNKINSYISNPIKCLICDKFLTPQIEDMKRIMREIVQVE